VAGVRTKGDTELSNKTFGYPFLGGPRESDSLGAPERKIHGEKDVCAKNGKGLILHARRTYLDKKGAEQEKGEETDSVY